MGRHQDPLGTGPAHQQGKQQLQDPRAPQPKTLGPRSVRQWASPSPGTHWTLASHTSGQAPALGSPVAQPCLPTGQHKPRDSLGPGPAPQQANTSFGVPQTLQPDMSGTGPAHQQADTRPETPSSATTPPKPSSAHQWASTSPGTTPPPPPPGPCSQQPHDPALPISSQQPPLKAGPGNQPDLEPATPTRLPTVVSQPQQKNPCNPNR
ncbi:proline-rich protein HaeIII subfamily 1-like [Eschrichtius robustus]|uniref:proline-rich protein HaeIII subfamily 1-like n=1 Tax=Eschrichtius robustus TaxID=9764 RepID=UPI0035C125B3